MDFLNDRIKPIYFKYLAAAFGSAMITSVYSIVDMAMPVTELLVIFYAAWRIREYTNALPEKNSQNRKIV